MKMVMESSSITTTTSNSSSVSSNSTESNNCQSSASLFNPKLIGREFVRQYYTVLNDGPHYMHRFYSEDSSLVHGGSNKQGELTVYGQENINQKILSLDFKDCHTKIRQVDSMETVGKGVVVQVIGELSNNGEPMRRFFQTFVLVPRSPSNYYVRNDIFRYQDEVFIDEDDYGDVEKVDDPEKKDELQPLQPVDTEKEDEVSSTTPTATTPAALTPTPVTKEHVFDTPNVNGAVSHNEISSTEKLSSSDTDVTTSKSESSFANVDDGWGVSTVEETNDEQVSVKDENGVTAPSYASKLISAPQQNNIHSFTKVDSIVGVTSGSFGKPSSDVPSGTPSYRNQFANTGNKNNFNSKLLNKSGYPRESKPNRPRVHQSAGGLKQKGDAREITPAFVDSEFLGEGVENFSGGGRKQQQQQQFSDDHQVFVGNLPQEITEGQLQEFFSKYGNIVDVRINRTNQKSGRTPNYGFVTFDDPSIVKHILTLKPIFFNDHRFNVEEKRSQSTRGSGGGVHGDRPGRDNSRSMSTGGNIGSSNHGPNMTRAINNSGPPSGRASGAPSGQRRERGERNPSFGASDSGRRNGGSGGTGPPRGGSTYNRR